MFSKVFVFILFVFTSVFAQAAFDTKNLAQNTTVMTRTMDLLMARQEMKDSLPQPVKLFLKKAFADQTAAPSDVTAKVDQLANQQSLKDCVTDSQEVKSPDGTKDDAHITYNGANCPLDMDVEVHIVSQNNVMNGKVQMNLKIVSPDLAKQFDVDQIVFPIQITGGVQPGNNNSFTITTDMTMDALIHSVSMGQVSYKGKIDMATTIGQTFAVAMKSDETYSAAQQTEEFVQVSQMANGAQTNTYSVNGSSVTVDQFNKMHSNVSVPGFDMQPQALEKAHTCTMQTYDSSTYSLQQVRQAIVSGTVDSLVPAETLPALNLIQTGDQQSQVMVQNQQIKLDVKVSQDAARFSFAIQNPQNGQQQELAHLTAVLGDKTDLTQQLLNRVVRVTCQPDNQ